MPQQQDPQIDRPALRLPASNALGNKGNGVDTHDSRATLIKDTCF